MHPFIEIPPPNQPILLGKEPARIRLRQNTLEGSLTARVTTVPRPKVTFEIEVPPFFGLDISQEAQVTLLSTGGDIPCRILKGPMFSEVSSTIRIQPLAEIAQGSPHAPIARLVFAIPNFPDFLAHGSVRKLPNGGGIREDEIRLPFSGWTVTIKTTADIAERKEILGEDGGFSITSIGVLEKADGRQFTWDDAEPHIPPASERRANAYGLGGVFR